MKTNTLTEPGEAATRSAGSAKLPAGLLWGSRLNILAGLIPFTVGTTLFTLMMISVMDPAGPWLSNGFNFGGDATFTLDELAAFNPQAADTLRMNTHVGYANLMISGFTIMMMGAFALPARWKPGYVVLAAMPLWIGLNDAAAVIVSGQTPIPLIPTTLGTIGLILAYPYVFGKRQAEGL